MVRRRLPNADELTLDLVTATAGLLAGVAYADRKYDDAEEQMIRAKLLALEALSRREINAICAILREDVAAGGDPSLFIPRLKELTDRWQRKSLLDVLVDVATADNHLSVGESRFLRETAVALELTVADYEESLARHPDVTIE